MMLNRNAILVIVGAAVLGECAVSDVPVGSRSLDWELQSILEPRTGTRVNEAMGLIVCSPRTSRHEPQQ
ncbi:hypothetical protein GBAR_LOCUS3800 [Geodia barretti]|uniref:Secreted protein n=1 Tax=Geodia barretti TaxID=519541 RepID=A0AA35R5A5_GEOBA|nr:hypothetical protein GBAR_LOCUS3800 [Geodia barretti]